MTFAKVKTQHGLLIITSDTDNNSNLAVTAATVDAAPVYTVAEAESIEGIPLPPGVHIVALS